MPADDNFKVFCQVMNLRPNESNFNSVVEWGMFLGVPFNFLKWDEFEYDEKEALILSTHGTTLLLAYKARRYTIWNRLKIFPRKIILLFLIFVLIGSLNLLEKITGLTR